MDLNLGQLVIELVGDYSQLTKDIEAAKQSALSQAKLLEKSFNTNFVLTPRVDDSELTDLNKHLTKKVEHLKEVRNYFEQNPITPRVDLSELITLKKELDELKSSGTIGIKVKAGLSSSAGSEVSSASSSSGSDREIMRGLNSIEKAIKSNRGESFTQAISTGITNEIGSLIGKNLLSGFKKNLGLDIGGATQSFTRAVSKPLAKVNPKSIQDFEDKIVSALEDAFVFKDKEGAKSKFKAAFQPIADEIQEIALTAAGEVVKVAAQPLRIRKRVLLAQSMQQAQAMSENIVVPDNEQIRKAKSIALITGGIDYQKGGVNTYFAENLVKRILPGSYSVPVTNPYSNDSRNLGNLYYQTKSLMGGNPNKPMPLDMLLHTNIEKGYNPDSVKMAAEAMAYRKAHPDKPLILGGTSGGSYVVEETMGILERAGIKNVKGLGITAPVNNLMAVANPKNYQSNVGEYDPLNIAMFGGKNVENKDHKAYKATIDEMGFKLPGLFQESELMKLVPKAGIGHALLPFLAKPEFQENIQSFLGDSIDPINKSFAGMRGEPNLHFYRKENDERPTITRTLAAAFGDPKTLKQIQANNFNGAEGYTFAVPQKPEWRRDNDFKSMMGNLPAAKNIANDIRPEYDSYVEFLNEMSSGLEGFLNSGGKAKQTLLASLDRAVEMYPELKEVQDRVMSTLAEQGRLIELGKTPASKDTRTAKEKYQDTSRLARINEQFPKGQQYLKDKRNAELDAALPDNARGALEAARNISKGFNAGYAELQGLIKSGSIEEATALAQVIKQSATSAKEEITSLTKSLGGDANFGSRLGSQLGQAKGQIGSVDKKTDQLIAKNKLSIPKNVVLEAASEAKNAGSNTVQGYAQGISKELNTLKEISKEVALAPVEVIKEELDIHSPSKVMEQLGKFAAEGFVQGFETLESLNIPDIFKSVLGEAKELISGFTTGALSVDKFTEGFAKLSSVAKVGLGVLAGVLIFKTFGDGLMEFGKQSIEVATNFENLDRRVSVVSGSIGEGAKNIAFLRSEAKRLNVDLGQTLDSGASFFQATKGTALEGAPSRQVVSAVSQASSVYGLSKDQQQRTYTALEQTVSKTIVGQEELRGQLAEALPNAAQVAARAYNTTAQSLDQLVKSGRLLAEDFLPKFAQELQAETSTGVESAANSSLGITNKFNNALTELQETIGKTLLPFRNLSLSTLADGINFIVKNGDLIKAIFASIAIVLTQSVWKNFGSYITELTIDLVTLGRSGAISFEGITSAAKGVLSVAAAIGEQFLIVGGLIALYEGLKLTFTDTSGEVGKQVAEQTRAIDAYRESLGKLNAESRNVNLNWLDQVKGSFTSFAKGKEIADTIAGVGVSVQNTNKAVADTETPEVGSAIQSVAQIDKQLEAVRMKRRTTIQDAPNSYGKLRDLQKQEADLLQQRQEALKPAVTPRVILDNQVEAMRTQLAQLKQYQKDRPDTAIYDPKTGRLTPGQDPAVAKQIQDAIDSLTVSLAKAEAEQDKLKKSIKDTLTELQLFENGWQDISATFDGTRQKLDQYQAIFNTQLANKEAFASITPRESEFTKNLKAQETLSLKIGANFAEIQQKVAELESQGIRDVLKNTGLNTNSSIADIRKQEGRSLDGTKEKLLLKSYGDLKELVVTTNDAQQQLAEQRAGTTKQIYDSNKSVADWLEAIQREGQELQLALVEAQRQIKNDQMKIKLKSALVGFQDNFVGSFVDSLISVIDTLNQPLIEFAQAQSQVLQNFNKYKDTIKQGIELQRGLPQQYLGSVANPNDRSGSVYGGGSGQVSLGAGVRGAGLVIIDSNNGKVIHNFSDITRHHANRGEESDRDYDILNGKQEEVRIRDGIELTKKDMVLENAQGNTNNVMVPAPTSGYARTSRDYGRFSIYDKPTGGKMIGNVLHLDPSSFQFKDGQYVQYGMPVGKEGGTGAGGKLGVFGTHAHVELPQKQWAQYVQDLQSGNFGGSGYGGANTMSAPRSAAVQNWMQTMASTYSTHDGQSQTGTQTASGIPLDDRKLTAAINETLKKQFNIKWGDKVQFLNPSNNKTVVVQITDSGPYEKRGGRYVPHSTRGFDLSLAAAKEIGVSLNKVQFRVLGKDGQPQVPSISDSSLVSNLRNPVSYGAGPAPFTNDAQLGIIAGADQAAKNLAMQNQQALLKIKLGTNQDLAKVDALLQQNKANFQLRDSGRDMRESVIKFGETREDQTNNLGYQNPQRELQTKFRGLNRTFRESDMELIKSEEQLTSVVGTAEATLRILQNINQKDLPEGFDLQNAIAKISNLLPSARAALGKVSDLLNTNGQLAKASLLDVASKFTVEEQARQQASATEIRSGYVSGIKQRSDRAKLLNERSGIGNYSAGDPLLLGQMGSYIESTGKYSDTISSLNRDLTTGVAAGKYGDKAAETISAMKQDALKELLRSLDTMRVQGSRDLTDRNLADKGLIIDRDAKVIQSKNDVLGAQRDSYNNFGLTYYSKAFDKQAAINSQGIDYQQRSLGIDQLQNTGQYSDESIKSMRQDLEQLNALKLDNINKEFSDMSGVIKGVQGDVTNVFKDFIMNSNNVGQSLGKILNSILSNFAGQASEQLSNQLFGSIFGFSDPNAAANQNGISSQPGSLGGIVGSIASLFGIGRSNGGLGHNIGNFGLMNSSSLGGLLGLGGSGSSGTNLFSDLFGGGGSGAGDMFSLIPGFAGGGMIDDALARERAMSGGKNPMLIVANDGERILNPQETQVYNRLLSSGKLPNYASGGMLGGQPVIGGGMMGMGGDVNVGDIHINGDASSNGSVNAPQLKKVLQAQIQQTIKQERRPGGSLNQNRPGLYDR
ncbi:MAG: tape measure protein [Nostoc sp.]|uniref:tape measure protein n=1 Tax=Nostoc sp. TaxID=1180 RepID=UPI002FF2A613